MTVYEFLRAGWRLLPAGFRGVSGVRRATQPLATSFREHNQNLYSTAYFVKDVDDAAVRASAIISGSIVRDLNPARVIDLGCGSGALLAAFARQGVETLGLEYSEAGRTMSRARGIDAREFDIRFDPVDPTWGRFDVACCTEVAEHIPAAFADQLVSVLVGLGQTVVFTAATPGQGGVDHVNEQPQEYWIEKFRVAGYCIDEELSRTWSKEWNAVGVKHWYWKNLMVFAEG